MAEIKDQSNYLTSVITGIKWLVWGLVNLNWWGGQVIQLFKWSFVR